jgi:hypothetical protein
LADPIEAPLLTTKLQNRNKCAPLWLTFSVCIDQNFGQTKCYKTELLLGTSCGLGEPFANPMGIHWEQGGKKKENTLEFSKK